MTRSGRGDAEDAIRARHTVDGDTRALARHPVRDRLLTLAWAIVVAVIVCWGRLSPYGLAVLVAVAIAYVGVSAIRFGELVATTTQRVLLGACFVPFASALWATDRGSALIAGVTVLAFAAAGISLSALFSSVSRPTRTVVFAGALIGYMAGSIVLLVELNFGAPVTLSALQVADRLCHCADSEYYRRLQGIISSIDTEVFNRGAVTAVVLVWPMLLGITRLFAGRARFVALGLVLAATVALALTSDGGTAVEAGVCGLAIVVLARLRLSMTVAVVGLGVTGATLATVPLVRSLIWVEQQVELPRTAKARLLIWHRVTVAAQPRMMTGIGANNTRYYTGFIFLPEYAKDLDRRRAEYDNFSDGESKIGNSHPHNGFLQIWLELGLLGALTACGLGLVLLREIARLPQDAAVWALGHFVSALCVIAVGFGVWQKWMVAAIVVASALITLSAEPKADADQPPADT